MKMIHLILFNDWADRNLQIGGDHLLGGVLARDSASQALLRPLVALEGAIRSAPKAVSPPVASNVIRFPSSKRTLIRR